MDEIIKGLMTLGPAGAIAAVAVWFLSPSIKSSFSIRKNEDDASKMLAELVLQMEERKVQAEEHNKNVVKSVERLDRGTAELSKSVAKLHGFVEGAFK